MLNKYKVFIVTICIVCISLPLFAADLNELQNQRNEIQEQINQTNEELNNVNE